jgi:AraC-like DNA-binding protein
VRDDAPRLHFTRVPALGLEYFHARELTYVYPPHLHEVHSIGVMLQGVETISLADGRVYTARAGSVLLINAEELHANESAASEYIAMKVPPATLREIAQTEVRFREPVADDAQAFAALQQLFATFADGSQLEIESEFVAAMSLLLERYANVSAATASNRAAVAAARDYLKAHFADDVSLAALTEVAGLSAFHLVRLFHAEVGVPPHEYQLQLRIAHARRLLRDGQPIAEAALQTGFFDQSHFSRRFKRIVGMTPGQYAGDSKIVQDGEDDDR